MEKRFNLPNTLTVLRFLLSPVFFYFLIKKEIELALISFMFVAVTDFADGWIARTKNQKTELGEMLDPLADKFMVLLAVMALTMQFGFPFFAVPLILLRDIVSLLGGVIFYKKRVGLWKAKLPGKVSTLLQVVTILSFIIDFPYKIILMWFAILFSVMTATIYIVRGVKLLLKSSG